MDELNTSTQQPSPEPPPVPYVPTEQNVVEVRKEPSALRVLLVSILIIVGLLAAFQIGIMVGFRKASYSFQWGENYHQTFAGPRQGFFATTSAPEFGDAHGTFGVVLKNDGSSLIIDGKDKMERNVLLYRDTMIRKLNTNIPPQLIYPNDRVVIIGEPSMHGEINAKFIRVFPAAEITR
jgi:hypothetical protein